MSDDDQTSAAVATEERAHHAGPGRWRRQVFGNLSWWQEGGLLLVAAVVLAVVIKSLFLQVYYIPSDSMRPGLDHDDKIVVQKFSYWFGGSPSRGDVVVFEDPGGWLDSDPAADETPGGLKGVLAKVGLYPSAGHLVKRVIGVPGDVVVCCDDQGRITVNGMALDEGEYIAEPPETEEFPCNGPGTGNCQWKAGPVPEGTVFVLGDNRYDSADSTAHLCVAGETDCTLDPFVDEGLIEGKVLAVVWPRGHLRLLSRPDVFDDVPDPQ